MLAAGPKPLFAKYTAYHGADQHLSGDPTKQTLSRGVRLEKAMEPHTLIVFAMNGELLPAVHGAPLRLLVPGWSGSASQKWLTRIWIRDVEHDGQGMKGTSYRVPTVPIVPGSESKGEGFRVRGDASPLGDHLARRRQQAAGRHARAERARSRLGDLTVEEVWLSIDFWSKLAACKTGSTHQPLRLAALDGERQAAHAGLLRDLGARRRQFRQEPTIRGGQLEPSGLRRQCLSPRRRAG